MRGLDIPAYYHGAYNTFFPESSVSLSMLLALNNEI